MNQSVADDAPASDRPGRPGERRPREGRSPWWPAALVVGVFLLAALPLIVTQNERGRGRFDQINYHEPAIYRFAEQLPTPDVSDYLSATTPGYHLVLAVVARYVSPSLVVLQLAGMLFTAALLGVLARWLTIRAGPWPAVLLALTLPASLYVFNAGVHLLPDNAAWLGVLTVLLVALRPRFDAVTLIGGGAALLALVLIRQSHLWAAGPLLASAWLGGAFAGRDRPLAEIGSLLGDLPARLRRTAIMGLAILPAFVAVALFARLWGGLTVPIYHDYMQGANPATPAFILAQLAVIAVFHVGYWFPPAWSLVRNRPVMLVVVLLAGLALVAVPPTTFNVDAGRYSGLWNISAKFPDLAGRTNLLLLVLAPCGAAALAAWMAGVGARNRWVLLAALAGFAAAVSMTLNAWARYHEPFLLIFAALASALLVRHGPEVGRLLRLARLAGPAALILVLAAVTVQKTRSEDIVQQPKAKQDAVERPLRELWPERWDRVERHGIEGETD